MTSHIVLPSPISRLFGDLHPAHAVYVPQTEDAADLPVFDSVDPLLYRFYLFFSAFKNSFPVFVQIEVKSDYALGPGITCLIIKNDTAPDPCIRRQHLFQLCLQERKLPFILLIVPQKLPRNLNLYQNHPRKIYCSNFSLVYTANV